MREMRTSKPHTLRCPLHGISEAQSLLRPVAVVVEDRLLMAVRKGGPSMRRQVLG